MKFAELHAGQHFMLGPVEVDPDEAGALEAGAFAERYDAPSFSCTRKNPSPT